jgi:hypothetical protein
MEIQWHLSSQLWGHAAMFEEKENLLLGPLSDPISTALRQEQVGGQGSPGRQQTEPVPQYLTPVAGSSSRAPPPMEGMHGFGSPIRTTPAFGRPEPQGHAPWGWGCASPVALGAWPM